MGKKVFNYGAVYEYTVTGEFNANIGDYLRINYNYSTRVINSLKREGVLRLNGEDVPFVEKCKENDLIYVAFPLEHPDCEAEDIPFGVIYEDDDVLIADKPAGLVTHSTLAHPVTTLASGIYAHWQQTGFCGKVRFVNRLDMDTSGIVVIAKNKYVHHFIQTESTAMRNDKVYLALVKNSPPSDKGIVNEPIGRREEFSPDRIVRPDGKDAVTYYEVVEKYRNYSLVRLHLKTGRTHQIRVHMNYIGCPVAGDSLYNGECELISRQALHAISYSFFHPRFRKRAEFNSKLPEDIKIAVEAAKNQ